MPPSPGQARRAHCLLRAVHVSSVLPAPPQVITLEGWVDIMYYVMDAHSFYNFIYFILLIIVSVGTWWDIRCKGWWGVPAL